MYLFYQEVPELAALTYSHLDPKKRKNTIWARTADEAISVIKDYREKLRGVYICYKPYYYFDVRNALSSGALVVDYIKRNYVYTDFKDCPFYIETLNPKASRWMYNRLKEKGFEVYLKRFEV